MTTITRREKLLNITREATFSKDLLYRFDLTIHERKGFGRILWIMLNPSTADELADDPTIRRCRGFSADWGFGLVQIVNLFALRSTNPWVLKASADPVGPSNDEWIRSAAYSASKIVVGWGVHGALLDRGEQVSRLLADRELLCLGRTKEGFPKHPLYLRNDSKLEPWRRP